MRGVCRTAADARGVVARSLGGALSLVPVWGARGHREIATVRAPRRLGGGSRRLGAGVGVVAGRARARRGGAGAFEGPPRPLARVNMRYACDLEKIEIYRDRMPGTLVLVGPRVYPRAK